MLCGYHGFQRKSYEKNTEMANGNLGETIPIQIINNIWKISTKFQQKIDISVKIYQKLLLFSHIFNDF